MQWSNPGTVYLVRKLTVWWGVPPVPRSVRMKLLSFRCVAIFNSLSTNEKFSGKAKICCAIIPNNMRSPWDIFPPLKLVRVCHGKIIQEEWLQTAVIGPYVILDEFVVMSNTFTGLLFGTWQRHAPTWLSLCNENYR